jgi:REP element-mobilizing transposase RayT
MRGSKQVPLAPRSGAQTVLAYEKRDKNGQGRGGRRDGAGRKRRVATLPKGKRYEPHLTRAAVNPRHPQHVTLTVLDDVAPLRKRDLYAAVKQAIGVANDDAFRIVHHSVQGNHLHLAVEANDKTALASGMNAFKVSCAKRINAAISRRTGVKRAGSVFADRYHATPITNVRQLRNVLSYIFNNWRHHAQSTRNDVGLYDGRLDPYSSAIWFEGWKERTTSAVHVPPDYDPPPRVEARTWLLKEGWRKAAPISCWAVPG